MRCMSHWEQISSSVIGRFRSAGSGLHPWWRHVESKDPYNAKDGNYVKYGNHSTSSCCGFVAMRLYATTNSTHSHACMTAVYYALPSEYPPPPPPHNHFLPTIMSSVYPWVPCQYLKDDLTGGLYLYLIIRLKTKSQIIRVWVTMCWFESFCAFQWVNIWQDQDLLV